MLVDLEEPHVSARDGLPGPASNGQRDPPEDLVGLLPGAECRPLVRSDHEHSVLRLLGAKEVHREGVGVEAHIGAGKGQPCKLEAYLRRGNRPSVARTLGDQNEQPIDAQLPKGALRERDVAEVRRVERAAEDRDRQSVTVSSPISISAPGLAPAARSAASSTGNSGTVPTTR